MKKYNWVFFIGIAAFGNFVWAGDLRVLDFRTYTETLSDGIQTVKRVTVYDQKNASPIAREETLKSGKVDRVRKFIANEVLIGSGLSDREMEMFLETTDLRGRILEIVRISPAIHQVKFRFQSAMDVSNYVRALSGEQRFKIDFVEENGIREPF